MHIVLITGISGSGKSVALHILEDDGYFCVDNLPPTLLCNLVAICLNEGIKMLAVATDARSANSLTSLNNGIRQLKNQGYDVKVIFLTATTESLITRFSETRRSHPLSHRLITDHKLSKHLTLTECIYKEREMLSTIEGLGHIIDTSNLSAKKLRTWIKDLSDTNRAQLILLFESFAFRFGVPLDADLVFDVRILPNPYYNITLRSLTGRDKSVISFLDNLPEVKELFEDIYYFIQKWLPAFKQDNRSYLTIAVGCTGGQHRSVYIVERLAHYFSREEHVIVRHRQLN